MEYYSTRVQSFPHYDTEDVLWGVRQAINRAARMQAAAGAGISCANYWLQTAAPRGQQLARQSA